MDQSLFMTVLLCLHFIDKKILSQFWRIVKTSLKISWGSNFNSYSVLEDSNFDRTIIRSFTNNFDKLWMLKEPTKSVTFAFKGAVASKQKTKNQEGTCRTRTRKQKYRDRMTISHNNLPRLSAACFVSKIHLFNFSALELFHSRD